ncbi:alpha/beta hydrolase [Pontibacter diazotrophicus]|uniref:Alpha/beta hydrolase n=1 Tax=Pontibacter diazotrophicus TaxID=1400979 RepID=A0A3D8L392_9BACT|nr:alpha/beta hydrolase [Pontibacter diazotrophicus]RDV11878.1 alpha/beta hydrolase [Pontibacter diazotrophicus]
MKKIFCVFLLFAGFFACTQSNSQIPSGIDNTQYYLFYLHGKIVEDQGIHASSERFGKYEYEKILNRLEKNNIKVISEPRPKGTDVESYSTKVANQINDLIYSGVNPENITVVGASKGSVIAMLISTKLANPKLNFVLLANCNNWVLENLTIDLHGDILSIYEKSDNIGRSCLSIKTSSSGVRKYNEVELTTGLGHGFIFQPIDEWVLPTIEWATKQ